MIDVFRFAIVQKTKVLIGFTAFYLLMFIVAALGGNAILRKTADSRFFYTLGVIAGRIALVFFCVTILPGVLHRFKLRQKWISVLFLFRRQLGIATFLLGFLHFSLVRFFWRLGEGLFKTSFLTFEIFGALALFFLFFLFLTSNDWSQKYLGVWWYRLHKLVYLIAWLIFGHTLLQRISFWSVLIGVMAVLEIVSFVYQNRSPKS